MRTFQVVQKVPWLGPVINRFCKPVFRGDVFYTNSDDDHGNPDEYFSTFDTHDYELLSKTSIGADMSLEQICPSWDGFSLAVIESVRKFIMFIKRANSYLSCWNEEIIFCSFTCIQLFRVTTLSGISVCSTTWGVCRGRVRRP